MRVTRLKRKPKHFKNFTGLTAAQFDNLLVAVKAARSLGGRSKAKQRAVGGGRKAKLAVEEQLLVTLLYYRLYVTQLLPGYLFDLNDSSISRLTGTIRPLLLEVLPLPAQETTVFVKDKVSRKRISTLAELLERHPEFKEVLVDATEQETHKPKDRLRRKGYGTTRARKNVIPLRLKSGPAVTVCSCMCRAL